MAGNKQEVFLLDLQNIIDSAQRLREQVLAAPDHLDDELFSKVRDLREEIIHL